MVSESSPYLLPLMMYFDTLAYTDLALTIMIRSHSDSIQTYSWPHRVRFEDAEGCGLVLVYIHSDGFMCGISNTGTIGSDKDKRRCCLLIAGLNLD